MHLVSVIVPIYKVERYLARCVDSILNQTYRKLEVILVNDGSPDNCGKICDEYAEKDLRIKVVHKENGGLSSARNAGLEIATGNYIAFVDSDDFISPLMLKIMVDKLEENSADLCICGFQHADENGTFLPQSTEGVITDGVMDRKAAFERLDGHYVVAWNKLYKKELFADLRFAEGRIHEDEFIMHYIFDKCKTIVTVSDMFYFYVQQSGSIMNSSYSIKRLDGARAALDRYLFFKNKGEKKFAERALKRAYGVLVTCLQRLSYWDNREEIDPLFLKIYKDLGFSLRRIKLILIMFRVRMKGFLTSR